MKLKKKIKLDDEEIFFDELDDEEIIHIAS